MTDSLYLLGAPGVGKSTVLAAYLDSRGLAVHPNSWRLNGRLTGHLIYDRVTGSEVGVYLGKMRDEYPGTDGLSMAVAPDAREWARTIEGDYDGGWLSLVVGEGARLGNVGFLTALAERTLLTAVLLTADEDALTARREGRGSTQTPSWMRGAATAARNAWQGTLDAGAPHRALHLDTTHRRPAEIVALLT